MKNNNVLLLHLDSLYKNNSKISPHTGIVQGETGLILCYFYASQLTNQECYSDKLLNVLNKTIENVSNDYSLGYGLAGLCWAIHLMKEKIKGSEEWLGDANQILLKKTDIFLQQKNLDLFQGAIGILYYFLNQESTLDYLLRLEKFLEIIEEKIAKNSWEIQSFRGDKWVTEINLGVPHGLTGILLFLLLIKEKNILNVDKQILELIKILLSYHRNDFKQCYFPSKVVDKNEWMESGIGWCYGDLTSAYALLKTGVLFDIKKYKDLSLNILRKTIDRDDYFHDYMILCHGYTSNALIYNKIYELSKEPYFLETANRWQKSSTNLFEKHYSSYIEKKEHRDFFDDPSLFYGFPGYFLSKLSWENTIDLRWCNCLLL